MQRITPRSGRTADAPRAFISYARRDGVEFALRLRRCLERGEPEITLWQDVSHMEGGRDWWQQITDALDHVEFLILVMTPGALRSEICRREWRYARQRGVCVYPVIGTSMPRCARRWRWLPSGVRTLLGLLESQSQPIDFSTLPGWMRRAQFYDLATQWETFVNHLKSPCREPRVPFMAPDKPATFVDRPGVFGELKQALLDETRKDQVTIMLHGAGGFGKTMLATALCHDDDVITAFDGGVLWTTLGQTPNPVGELAKLYEVLTGDSVAFVDVDHGAVKVAERLGDRNCLLVLDDVWDPAHLRPFMRGGPGCTRLVTTRQLAVVMGTSHGTRKTVPVKVGEMQASEAAEVLTSGLGHEPTNLGTFLAIAEALCRWPLLLALAAGVLRERLELNDTIPHALAWLHEALGKRGVTAFDKQNPSERSDAVAQTLALSLGLLNESERRQWAELAVFPEHATVSFAAVESLWACNSFDCERTLCRLAGASLLEIDLGRRVIRIHDVVRACMTHVVPSAIQDPTVLHARLVDAWGDPRHLQDAYGWRWVAYHMAKARRWDDLRTLLLDYEWIEAKLAATHINDLIRDYNEVQDDALLQLVQGALRLGAHVLAQDPSQLRSQLHARLLLCHDGALTALGQQIACSRKGHWIRLLNPTLTPPGGPLLRTLNGHSDAVTAVAVTPDGQRAVSASHDRTLMIWDLESGQQVGTLQGHSDTVSAVIVTTDGQRIISASRDRTLKVWDAGSGKEVATLQGHSSLVNAVAVTPDGKRIVSASSDNTLKVWDLGSGQVLQTLDGHSSAINAVAVAPGGQRIISACADNTLKIWDLDSGQELCTLEGHAFSVTAVAVTADGQCAVSTSHDNTLKVWDLHSGQVLRTLRGHTKWVTAVAIVPNSHRAVSASWDHGIKLWNLDSGQELRSVQGHTEGVTAVAVTPDGRRVVSASYDNTLKCWDVVSAEELHMLQCHSDGITAVAVTPNGRRVVSASHDSTLKLWDLVDSGKERRTLVGHSSSVTAVAISHDGRHAVSASDDATLKVWDLDSGQELLTLRGHPDSVTAVAVTENGERAVSASLDNTIKLWDVESGQELHTLQGHSEPVTAVAITPSGVRAASGSRDKTVRVWDLLSGTELRRLDGHSGSVTAVVLTNGGQGVISASDDATLRVWDLDSGRELHTLRGHDKSVNNVVVTYDGRYAISASDDCTLRIWDLATGQSRCTLRSHTRRVTAVAVTPDGQRAISTSDDHTFKVWDCASGSLVATFSAEGSLNACAILADGATLIAGGDSGHVHFARLEKGREDGVASAGDPA